MEAKIFKLTDLSLLQRAASFTSGKDCHMSLATAYRHQHSIIRTQQFWIELTDIPLFVASQLVRSHVGVQFFQRSKRPDRGGEDFSDVCNGLANDIEKVAHSMLFGNLDNLAKLHTWSEAVSQLPDRFDRLAPTDLAFICNAEMLINTSHKRLCYKASQETRNLWTLIVERLKAVDPDLARHCVAQCVYRGGICPEPHSCGFATSDRGSRLIGLYKDTVMQP